MSTTPRSPGSDHADAFSGFFRRVEPRLRHALTAGFGPEVGSEAAAEALAYGWANWHRVGVMANPAGYLFRVGESRARRKRQSPLVLPPAPVNESDWVEPGLPAALANLSQRERQVIVLVEAFGYPQRDVAQLLQLSPSSVQSYQQRGMSKLRRALRVGCDD